MAIISSQDQFYSVVLQFVPSIVTQIDPDSLVLLSVLWATQHPSNKIFYAENQNPSLLLMTKNPNWQFGIWKWTTTKDPTMYNKPGGRGRMEGTEDTVLGKWGPWERESNLQHQGVYSKAEKPWKVFFPILILDVAVEDKKLGSHSWFGKSHHLDD